MELPGGGQVKIEDKIGDPKVVGAVKKHLNALQAAGVESIQLSQEKVPHYKFVPNPNSRSSTNGVNGDTVRDGEDMVTTITPKGGNTRKSNEVMEAIAKDLKASGIGNFEEAAIFRCLGSPTYLHSKQPASESRTPTS